MFEFGIQGAEILTVDGSAVFALKSRVIWILFWPIHFIHVYNQRWLSDFLIQILIEISSDQRIFVLSFQVVIKRGLIEILLWSKQLLCVLLTLRLFQFFSEISSFGHHFLQAAAAFLAPLDSGFSSHRSVVCRHALRHFLYRFRFLPHIIHKPSPPRRQRRLWIHRRQIYRHHILALLWIWNIRITCLFWLSLAYCR